MSEFNFKSVLDAAETALGVIESAGNIPGVDLIPYVGTVLKFVGYAKKGIEVGKAIAPDVADFVDTFSGGLPSPEKRAALDARIASNHAKIQGFTPVAEAGEEE